MIPSIEKAFIDACCNLCEVVATISEASYTAKRNALMFLHLVQSKRDLAALPAFIFTSRSNTLTRLGDTGSVIFEFANDTFAEFKPNGDILYSCSKTDKKITYRFW